MLLFAAACVNGSVKVAQAPRPALVPPVDAQDSSSMLALRPIEPDLPPAVTGVTLAAEEAMLEAEAGQAAGVAGSPLTSGVPLTPAVPVVSAPMWLRTAGPTILWSAQGGDAHAFTDVPAGSMMRVEGPRENGRWLVFYVGDGLFRRPGVAWVDAASVLEVDAPAPGEVPAVDEFARRRLPEWVQVHRATRLWSGPDAQAEAFTDLPQWSYLKVAGIARDGRMLVEYAGDFHTRHPGLGWVDEAAVGPAADPGRWVQNHRASALWSGNDESASRFTDLPQWSRLRVVEDGRQARDRILVEYFGDGGSRQPGLAWVPRADIGPITPPTPLPAPARPATGAPAPRPAAAPRTFTSQADFIETVGVAARRSQRLTGVPASVTVAQAILESDWGRSDLTRMANNLFGIKAFGVPGSAGTITLPTWEYLDGGPVRVQAAFKAYHSLDESVDDHGRFFVRNRRYAGALRVGHDPHAFARAIQDAGYATDPGYAVKLIRLMDRYNLYRFDP